MSLDAEHAHQRLTALWEDETIRALPVRRRKYAIVSDLHLGDGGKADDFKRNEAALRRALTFYKRNGYHLILLGDIEEFWQFDLDRIRARYDAGIYTRIRAFGDRRVYRVFGNHDYEWGSFRDPVRNRDSRALGAPEALKLKDAKGAPRILLVHGHQGSRESDRYAWFSRFWVRLFRWVEPFAEAIGADEDPSLPKSRIKQDYEKVIYNWAKQHKAIVICGHSHRAIFASKSYVEYLRHDAKRLESEIRRLGLKQARQQRIRGSAQPARSEGTKPPRWLVPPSSVVVLSSRSWVPYRLAVVKSGPPYPGIGHTLSIEAYRGVDRNHVRTPPARGSMPAVETPAAFPGGSIARGLA